MEEVRRVVGEGVGRQGVLLREGAQVDQVRVGVLDGGADAVRHVLRAAFLRHDAERRDGGNQGISRQRGENAAQALLELSGCHIFGHDVVAADRQGHQVGAVGALQQAQAAHLGDLGQFDGFDGGARQGEVEHQDLTVQLLVNGGGQARRVGLGDARGAHALHGRVAQRHDQVGALALGVFVKLTQALQRGQVVVLPGAAVVASLRVQSQQASDRHAAAEETRAASRRASHLPCSFADPHVASFPRFRCFIKCNEAGAGASNAEAPAPRVVSGAFSPVARLAHPAGLG